MHLGPLPRRILARILSPHAESRRSAQVQRGTVSSAPQRSGDSAAPRRAAWQPRAHYSTAKWIIRLTIVTFGEPEHIPRFPRISVVAMESKAPEPVRWYHWELYSRCYHCMRRASESECIHARIEHEIISMKSLGCACSLGSLVCISLVNSMPVHAAAAALCSRL